MDMTFKLSQPHFMVCSDCIPAGSAVERWDDYRGYCDGCGRRSGNMIYAPVYPLVKERGSWATVTGRTVGPATR